MLQISSPYRRRNIGPLTAYGRFKGYNRSARRYNRGWRRPGAWGAIATYRGRIPRPLPRSSYDAVTAIVKTVIPSAIQYPGAAGSARFHAAAHYFSELADSSSYGPVFDQYRIVGVQVKLIQRQDAPLMEGNSTLQNTAKYALITIDTDDADTPTQMATLQGYASCRTWDMLTQKTFKFFYRPRVSQAAWSSGAFSGYTQAPGGYRGPWVDMANQSVPYYAWKIGIQSQAAVNENEWTIDVIYKYYIQLKGQR